MATNMRTSTAANARDMAIPVLIAAAQDLAPSKCNGETSGRRYQYHPYEPHKRPRHSAISKKRKPAAPQMANLRKSKGSDLPSTDALTGSKSAACMAPSGSSELAFVPLVAKQSADFSIANSTSCSPQATMEQIILRYTQNQMQMQSLMLQQTIILQHLQAVGALSSTAAIPDTLQSVTGPQSPISLLSPDPTTPIACPLSFDVAGNQLTPPPCPTESEPDTPVSPPSAVSLEAWPAMNIFDSSCDTLQSIDTPEAEVAALTSIQSLDSLSIMGQSTSDLCTDFEELLTEFNQDLSVSWD